MTRRPDEGEREALAALRRAADASPGDAGAQADYGSALVRLGRHAEALPVLRRALGLRADDVRALIETADCLRELGQPAQAVAVYQEALRLDRRQPEALSNLGNALLQLGQPQEAITAYRLALELRPDSAPIQFNLANAQRQAGLLDEAVAGSRRAIGLDARLAPAHNNLGLALLALGRRDEAIEALRTALAVDPGNVDVRANLDRAVAAEGGGASGAAVEAVEAEAARIRLLIGRGEFAKALAAAETLVRRAPHSGELLFAMALCQRMLSRLDEALGTLDRLQRLYPDFSRQYQERGICLATAGQGAAAIEALSRAVELNPALPAAWSALEALQRAAGNEPAAQRAASRLAALKGLHPVVLAATSLLHDGDLAQAEAAIRGQLGREPGDPEAVLVLGRIALRRGAPADARLLFERALALAPGHRAARYHLAHALMEANRHPQARTELQALLAEDPANPDYRLSYARACGACGDHERAVQIYRALIDEGVEAPALRQWLGNALKAIGRGAEAIGAYHEAVALRPAFGAAWWSLADLKTYRFTDDETARMRRAVEAVSTGAVDRYHLCFALGKALEDRGDYAAAFEYYARGNALRRADITYRPDPEGIAARQIKTCSAAFLSSRAGAGAPDPDPIFIVGLPRSGSTLLEQILASHPLIEGTRELTELPGLVAELQGRDFDAANPRYPRVLTGLGAADFRRLGQRYLDETRAYRSGRPFFIDKLSGNFRHIGFIHLILPNAKIIDARREPMACCFGNFKQLFASGQEFTYSLGELARYYRSYLDLMRHWDRVLPGKVLRVQHEDVVADLEGSVRRMLDFCGVGFEPACLEFHRTARSIRTASAEQVRQPIDRDSLDQWRHFEPWLGELRAALGDALSAYRD